MDGRYTCIVLKNGEVTMTMRRNVSYLKALSHVLILCLCLCVVSGCNTRGSEETSSEEYSDHYYIPTTDADGHGPTGLPEGVIEHSQIMFKGKIYECLGNNPLDKLPGDDYKEVGTILEVDAYNMPTEDFCATGTTVRLRSGQKVFSSENVDSVIIVQCEDTYHLFRLQT